MTIHFPLPSTSIDHPPAFVSVLSCQDWLAGVPLANSAAAQVMLLKQINALNAYTLTATDRLAMLETLRPTVSDVQDEMAKKFACKPLPLTPPEQAALDGTIALWHAVLNGYLRLINCAESEPSLTEERARIIQRALAVCCDWQLDLCRGALLPGSDYWSVLHKILAIGEKMAVLSLSVDDGPRHGSTLTSPLAAYGEAVMLFTANAFELLPRQLNWVARWSKRWGVKLALLQSAPTTVGNRALPIFVDLASDRPPCYFPKEAQEGRWLETTALRKSLKTRLALLEKGEQPSRLNMGEDCTQPAAGQLLLRAYQRWCKGGSPRKQERKSTTGTCEFIVSLNAAHYYLSGRQVFQPPMLDDQALRRDREALATFGEARRKNSDFSEQQGFDIESWSLTADWQLLDQSTSGLRLARPLKEGLRVGVGQLVAVKLAGSSQFVLGTVRWALQTLPTDGPAMLSTGIELYPGIAQPIAVRGGDPGTREAFRQGLRLPSVAALSVPETLIVPYGTYRVGRPIEILAQGQTEKIKLAHVLDRTQEFERCTYTAI